MKLLVIVAWPTARMAARPLSRGHGIGLETQPGLDDRVVEQSQIGDRPNATARDADIAALDQAAGVGELDTKGLRPGALEQ